MGKFRGAQILASSRMPGLFYETKILIFLLPRRQLQRTLPQTIHVVHAYSSTLVAKLASKLNEVLERLVAVGRGDSTSECSSNMNKKVS